MSYLEADKLSKRNKEFIKSLFPTGDVWASLLPQDAQDVIGKVGRETRGVEIMLRRIGFQYCNRIDPFDGGPHFTARMDEITLIAHTRRTRAHEPVAAAARSGRKGLVAVELPDAPFFRGVMAPIHDETDHGTSVGHDAWDHLGLQPQAPIVVLPFET